MMQSFWQFLTSRTSLLVMGWIAFAALLLLGAALLELPTSYALGVLAIAMALGVLLWLWRWRRRRTQSAALGGIIEQQARPSGRDTAAHRQEQDIIKKRLVDVIGIIKGSKLGHLSGDAALYELPWYMVIGNPAAGKSTAIASSGLQFFFDGNKVVQGVGGTRNCDWFFTTEGILLDTAGRFSVADEDREEWFGFLGLLKKYRKKAPINGIIIAVSVAELTGNRPEFAIKLAKNLRQRVQELTEKLEVNAPVYVVFTKADLITGFNEFFQDDERAERERVWGSTLPYSQSTTGQQVLDQFDARFDELYEGLKDKSRANMALQWREKMPPGVFTFPLEFAGIKAPLRSFMATLFEDNPYQFKPVFRGFYFTSALQEGASVSPSSISVADQFGIRLEAQEHVERQDQQGYFLLNLFRKVIFADRDLVAQYASPVKLRMRYGAFFAATAVVGLALGSWSWSYMNNRQLVDNVEADLAQAVRVQAGKIDLESRFEALAILQKRIEQLSAYREDTPLSLGLGMYQGDLLERKLREEYFTGVREIMLKPVSQSLEAFLTEVNKNADLLQPSSTTPAAPQAMHSEQFQDASPANSADAYNALKTYLMLSDKTNAEGSHLNDQLSRYWRTWLDANRGTMSRAQMIGGAERIVTFYVAQISDTSWQQMEGNVALIDHTRQTLRKVFGGMKSIERVYAHIKSRSATQFPSMTVARIVGEDKELVLGSYAIAGSFTREAWSGYVQKAIRDVANKDLQIADWVLKSSVMSDVTVEGSPEHIEKALLEKYKNEYAHEWQKFMQGVSIRELNGFDGATVAMNRLGDPQTSPLSKIINTVYEHTSWDNPTLVDAGLQRASRGVTGWFKEVILRQKPSRININMPTSTGPVAPLPLGPVGKEFAGVARMTIKTDQGASLMNKYMEHLSKLRTRFNVIKNQGDPGPGAKQLMQQTLADKGSELADALKFVDEQMLTGMTDAQKTALRPLLVRPLMQSFAVIIKPTEVEINKVWAAQVLQPFKLTLVPKFPFSAESGAEASNEEIGVIFGPGGSIAKFFDQTIGPLVERRGDTIEPKTWAQMGINLAQPVVTSFPSWIAPLSAESVASATTAASPAPVTQTLFELQALGATSATEFTIEIDGQALRWKGQPQPWVKMMWPNRHATPGSRITAITPQGQTVVLLDEPGRDGLRKMIDAAKSTSRADKVFELSWQHAGVQVTANLKLMGQRQTPVEPVALRPGLAFKGLRLPDSVIALAPVPAPVPAPGTAPASVAVVTGAAQ